MLTSLNVGWCATRDKHSTDLRLPHWRLNRQSPAASTPVKGSSVFGGQARLDPQEDPKL